MALLAMLQRFPWLSILGTLGVILGAWYSLRLVCDLMFGQHQLATEVKAVRTIKAHEVVPHPMLGGDLLYREWIPLVAMGAICLWIGCLPQTSLGWLKHDVDLLSGVYADLDQQLSKTSSE